MSSAEVAEVLAEDEPADCPVCSSAANTVGQLLRHGHLRGEVVQIRSGKRTSRWGLPGTEIPEGWNVVPNPRSGLEAELLDALRRRGGEAFTAELADDLGMGDRSGKGKVTFALTELSHAGKLTWLTGSTKNRWALET